MSLEFALAQFDGEGAAVQSYAAAKDRPGPDQSWMQEVGFVERHHNGRLLLRGNFAGHYVDVDESDRVSLDGAGVGAAAGGLVGVFLGPVGIALGLMIGASIGADAGTPTDTEAQPEDLAEQLRAAVPRSSSAIVLIAPSADVDEMVEALGDKVQHLTRHSLSAEQEASLEASLGMAPRTSTDS